MDCFEKIAVMKITLGHYSLYFIFYRVEDLTIINSFEDFNYNLLILKANSKVLDNKHSNLSDWENCGFVRSLLYIKGIFYTLSKAVAFTADTTPLLKRLDNAI